MKFRKRTGTERPIFRRILVGVLLPALAMGCSHTIRLGPQAPPERWQKAQRRLEGRKAEVVLRDGRRFRADGVEVSPEAVVWWEAGSGTRHSASPGDVEAVCYRDRGRGALEGAGLGLLAGAGGMAAYGAIAASASDCPPNAWLCFNHPVAGAVLGAILGALIGPPVGLAIGAVRGSQTCVRFASDGSP
jgi:hypothetical protein